MADKNESCLSHIKESNLLSLKQKYQTKKQARRALLYAIRDPKRFRSPILACRDERVKVFVISMTSSIERLNDWNGVSKYVQWGNQKCLL